jgi:YVTN family beta-propeller protein
MISDPVTNIFTGARRKGPAPGYPRHTVACSYPWRGVFGLLVLALPLFLFSCKKKSHPEDEPAPERLEHGILVLDEGLFNLNNSGLTWIDTESHSVNQSFFEQKTGRGLGDTGNDLARYGNKIYAVVNVSSTLEILDAVTGAPLQQISMISGNTPQQPRSVAFYGSKAYVSCFDGFVSVIDTASLTVTQRIQAGSNPEGLAVSNGKLYVANSGGLNSVMDSTVSVISLASGAEIARITVGLNPGAVCADSQGDIYVVSRGNYGSIPARMHRINTITDTKAQTFSFDAGGLERMNDKLLVSYYDLSSENSAIGLFDALTETMISASYIPTTGIQTLYSVHYSPLTNKIYCSDANNYTNTGFLHVFSASGAFERTYDAGLNPSKIIVYE